MYEPKAPQLFTRTHNGKGILYSFKRIRPGTKEGTGIDVEYRIGNHLSLEFRSLYETESGGQGNKRIFAYSFVAQEAVQLASILFFLADEYMRDSKQEPYYSIASTSEKAAMGPNWIREDYASASQRVAMRESRSYVFNLMKQFVETCDDNFLFSEMANIFIEWGSESDNLYINSIAKKARDQMPGDNHTDE